MSEEFPSGALRYIPGCYPFPLPLTSGSNLQIFAATLPIFLAMKDFLVFEKV